jgi:hypothetical protein
MCLVCDAGEYEKCDKGKILYDFFSCNLSEMKSAKGLALIEQAKNLSIPALSKLLLRVEKEEIAEARAMLKKELSKK